eukprot:3910945-Pyramimonas_sp.AAC.1
MQGLCCEGWRRREAAPESRTGAIGDMSAPKPINILKQRADVGLLDPSCGCSWSSLSGASREPLVSYWDHPGRLGAPLSRFRRLVVMLGGLWDCGFGGHVLHHLRTSLASETRALRKLQGVTVSGARVRNTWRC